MTPTRNPAAPSGWGAWDLLVFATFLLYAVLFGLSHWQGVRPFVELGGDSANILSWAVALNDPASFHGDSALADPSALRFYATIHIPLMRLLGPLIGDYGTAWMLLLGPHVFLQVSGFYLLGRVIFRQRFFAYCLSAITVVFVWINLGTYWGAYAEPQPRFTFQALIPFVLCLAILWRDRPYRWPWLMGLTGLLMYVHPVSAPAWAFGIWLGLWAGKPTGWSTQRLMAYRGLAAAAFLIVAAPFVILYAGSHSAGTAAPSVVARAIEMSLPPDYGDIGLALGGFLDLNSDPVRSSYWFCAGLGVVAVWLMGGRDRDLLTRLLLWTVGILVVSVGLTWVDQSVAVARGTPPLQVDLVRGIRYLIPIKLLCVLWPFAALEARVAGNTASPARWALRSALILSAAILTTVWSNNFSANLRVGPALQCWRHGQLVCPSQRTNTYGDVFNALREYTPPGSRFLATKSELPPIIRFYSRRPVVHAFRDISVYLYARRDLIPAWQARVGEMKRIVLLRTERARFTALLQFAALVNADYALIDRRFFPEPHFQEGNSDYEGHQVPWRSHEYAVVRVARSSGG